MGAKYQPSIIYKVRHVVIQSDQLQAITPSVKGVSTEVSPYEPSDQKKSDQKQSSSAMHEAES